MHLWETTDGSTGMKKGSVRSTEDKTDSESGGRMPTATNTVIAAWRGILPPEVHAMSPRVS